MSARLSSGAAAEIYYTRIHQNSSDTSPAASQPSWGPQEHLTAQKSGLGAFDKCIGILANLGI